MNFIDKIANRFGYAKRPSRQNGVAARHFQAAMLNRLTASWRAQNNSIDKDLWKDLKTLRARSRDLAKNNDYIKQFLRLTRANVVGSQGFILQCQGKDNNSRLDSVGNQLIEDAWSDWGRRGSCDVTGKLSWVDCQNLFIESVARDGEILVRLVRNFPNKYGFALQFIEADHLDEDHNEDLNDGRIIRMGVEYDQWRRPIAYHIRQSHPGDYLYGQVLIERLRIPANEILHPFVISRPHQTRGIPWAHSAMFRLNMLAGYEDAEVTAARLEASKAWVLKPPTEGGEYRGDEQLEDGSIMNQVEPGMVEVLPAGFDIQQLDPQHPAKNFEAFLKATLKGISSGLGISYSALTYDLRDVNYSSIRAGLLQERDEWLTHQRWMIEAFCQPIYEVWLEMAMLKGAINLPMRKYDKFQKTNWQARRWQWVDPEKDSNANKQDIQLGVKTLAQVIRETGRDPDEVFVEISETRKKLDALGLSDITNALYESKGTNNGAKTTGAKDISQESSPSKPDD